MSTNLPAYAQLKTGLEAVVADVSKLKATRPNLEYFAQQLGEYLNRFEANVTSSFTDKFAGSLFRATSAWDTRVTDIEKALPELEKMLEEQAAKYDEMLSEHHARAEEMLKAQETATAAAIAGYEQKLKEYEAKHDELLIALASYDANVVDVYNRSLHLSKSSEKTLTKVDAVVDKFDQISSETLTEVAVTAKEMINGTSLTAKLQIEKVVADTQMHVEGTRKRYLKTLTALDNRILEHPIFFVLTLILLVSIGTSFFGVYLGRIAEAKHTQQLVDAAVDSATAKVEERMQRIEEQTKSLSNTFEEAQYWESLTNNMSYDRKMEYIKQAQQLAQQQGRKLSLPKSMQELGKR
jgi:predicted  nucleic acid-binding Zn-ribbon protein